MKAKKLVEREKEEKREFEIVPVEDLANMTIAEAIERGMLPTPIEMAKNTEEIVEMGKQTGQMYGYAIASIYSAIRRRDLPFPVRLAKGVRGATFLMSLFFSAMDTVEQIKSIEDRVLIRKGKVLEDADIDALLEELDRLRKENEELKRKKEEK